MKEQKVSKCTCKLGLKLERTEGLVKDLEESFKYFEMKMCKKVKRLGMDPFYRGLKTTRGDIRSHPRFSIRRARLCMLLPNVEN